MKKNLLLLSLALVTPVALHGQNSIGEVFSSDASVRGSVILSGSGTHVLSGSQVTAGDGTALLKLHRGGEVRICPRTNLSLSADENGKALVLGLNAGSMELNYAVRAASDSLITPDFRLQLISPGTFHLAVSVSSNGDTCLRSLPGDAAAVFVSEMMSGDSYQLSPGKSVMFRAGKISGATDAPAICGCPDVPNVKTETATAPEQAPATAELPALGAGQVNPLSSALNSAPDPETKAPSEPAANQASPQNPSAPHPSASQASAPHLEVDSAFVYRGDQAVEDYYTSVSRLSVSRDNSKLVLALVPRVSAPGQRPVSPEKKPGILRRFGDFVGKFFRG